MASPADDFATAFGGGSTDAPGLGSAWAKTTGGSPPAGNEPRSVSWVLGGFLPIAFAYETAAC